MEVQGRKNEAIASTFRNMRAADKAIHICNSRVTSEKVVAKLRPVDFSPQFAIYKYRSGHDTVRGNDMSFSIIPVCAVT